MCQGCVDAVQRYYPDSTEDERMALLWNATPFPFGGPEDVRRSLLSARRARCKTVGEALARADKQTWGELTAIAETGHDDED